jgi:hypothetical protein
MTLIDAAAAETAVAAQITTANSKLRKEFFIMEEICLFLCI